MVSPKSEPGQEFASRHERCIAVVAISDGDQYSAHTAACSMMVSFMSDDRRVLVEMPKPAVPRASCTKLLVDFFYCVPNTKLHIEILTWHTLNFNPRSATGAASQAPPPIAKR